MPSIRQRIPHEKCHLTHLVAGLRRPQSCWLVFEVNGHKDLNPKSKHEQNEDEALTFQGREPFKQYLSMLLTAFPDLHVSIEDVIGEGGRVVVRCTLRGTHQGELMGIAPTGKQVAVTGIAIMLIANGKLVEEWANTDTLDTSDTIGASDEIIHIQHPVVQVTSPIRPSGQFMHRLHFPCPLYLV